MTDPNSHIPTSEIKQDIADTQAEINQYQDEIEVLSKTLWKTELRFTY